MDQAVLNFFVAHRTDELTSVLGAISFIFRPILVLVWAALSRQRLIILTALVTNLLAPLLKVIIQRPRPTLALADYSMPSGHAMTIVAVALAVGAVYPRLRWAAGALAVVVCVSRLYLGVHWFSDVLVGTVIGYLAFRRMKNTLRMVS